MSLTKSVRDTAEWQEVKLCNCSVCGKELLGESMRQWFNERVAQGKPVAGCPEIGIRSAGRPYCKFCYGRKK